MKLCEIPGHMILSPDYPDQSTAYCVTCATGGVINSPAEQAAYKAFRREQDAKPDAQRWDHVPWDVPTFGDMPQPIRSDPSTFTFTATIHRTGAGDGRGGNARDRRKARRAGRIWRSLADVVRDGARLCVDCGDPISARILERRPTAKRCSTCCVRAMFGR